MILSATWLWIFLLASLSQDSVARLGKKLSTKQIEKYKDPKNSIKLAQAIHKANSPSARAQRKSFAKAGLPVPGRYFNVSKLNKFHKVNRDVSTVGASTFLTYSLREGASCLPSKDILFMYGYRTAKCYGSSTWVIADDDDYDDDDYDDDDYDDDFFDDDDDDFGDDDFWLSYSYQFSCDQEGQYFTVFNSNDCTGTGTTYDYASFLSCSRYDSDDYDENFDDDDDYDDDFDDDDDFFDDDDDYDDDFWGRDDDDDLTFGYEFTCETSPEFNLGAAFLVTTYYDDQTCGDFSFFDAVRADYCFGYTSFSFKYTSGNKKYHIWFENGECQGSPTFSMDAVTAGCFGRRMSEEEEEEEIAAGDDIPPDPGAGGAQTNIGTSVSQTGTVAGSTKESEDEVNIAIIIGAVIGAVVGVCCLIGLGIFLCKRSSKTSP